MMRPTPHPNFNMRIYGQRGERLYLDEAERHRFLAAVKQQEPTLQTLCLVLFYTGCRLSEALALTPDSLRIAEGVICFRTLKRRGLFVREVPVPEWLLYRLQAVHGTNDYAAHDRIWPIHRGTAWRRMKRVMAEAEIVGPQGTPKGLRHGFGVHAIRCGIPLNLLQRWLGHSQLNTTIAYLNVTSKDAQGFASFIWKN